MKVFDSCNHVGFHRCSSQPFSKHLSKALVSAGTGSFDMLFKHGEITLASTDGVQLCRTLPENLVYHGLPMLAIDSL